MSATFLFCVWLIPAPVDYKPISQEILNLATQFSFPYFEPHTTLFCGKTKNLTVLKENFKKSLQNIQKITVKTNGAQVQNEVTRNFFIRLQATSQLSALYQQVKKLDENSQYSFEKPHLSLSYGVPVEKINAYAANYVIPKDISFDQISLRPLKNGSEVLATINMTEKKETLLKTG